MAHETSPGVRQAVTSRFVQLDELLAKVLTVCGITTDVRVFNRYQIDLLPHQISAVAEGVAHTRQQLVAFGKHWNLALPAPPVLSSHALKVSFEFLDNTLDEMAVARLRGYGTLSEDFSESYRQLCAELRCGFKAMMLAALHTANEDP